MYSGTNNGRDDEKAIAVLAMVAGTSLRIGELHRLDLGSVNDNLTGGDTIAR